MTQTVFGYAFILFTTVLILAADLILKRAADADMQFVSRPVVLGCVIYVICALLWFVAMRHISLAQAGVAFSMLSLLAVCAMGVAFFGEKLQMREVLGIGCALLSMCLMIRTE